MKKILALVLALTMVLGTFTFAAAAPEDVVGEDCEDAVARLGALGIIAGFPDGTYRPDEPVTRAQFAKIIVSALGVGEAAQYAAGATKFADVPADHWATGFINVAVDVGVINGYPDGTFLPENQVTFAEAIKMIVAALGYTPKAEALGGYPGGYLAVAAEEEITDGVNVVGTLSANRGAVAMMVDNALDVYLMEQVSYGDSPRWEASDTKTLLNTKLGVKEVEGNVVGIARTEKLAENKFKIDGDDAGTYEMVIDVNTESLFLKEVKLLHKDKKVVWVSVETAADDIVFDTVSKVTKKENTDGVVVGYDVTLKVEDDDFKIVEVDDIYVNYDNGAPAVGDYGYFIFDGKEIVAANLFRFEEEGFVTGVEEDEIEYVALEGAEDQVLEIDDYDEVYVYNKDFTKADIEDIDENSVIFCFEGEDDELFVMVVNETVEGVVTRLRDDRVTIDGENYKRAAGMSIVSFDEGDDFDEWGGIDDVMDEEVILYLDLNGEIAAMVTDAQATTDELFGIVTWFYEGRNPSVEIFTSEGEEVEYYFEKDAEADQLNTVDFKNNEYLVIQYELNSDGEIAKGSIKNVTKFDVVTDLIKDSDKKFLTNTGKTETYFIDSDTVLMKALDGEKVDPELVDYEALVDMALTSNGNAIIIGDEGKTADIIVFTHKDFKGTKEDVYYGVVTDDPWKVGDDWFAAIDVFEEGKADYQLNDKGDVKKGHLVKFVLDSKDELDEIVKALSGATASGTRADIVTGTVYSRSGSYITFDDGNNQPDSSEVYRVESAAVLYKMDGTKLDGTTRFNRINKNDEVTMLYDDDEKVVKAILVVDVE